MFVWSLVTASLNQSYRLKFLSRARQVLKQKHWETQVQRSDGHACFVPCACVSKSRLHRFLCLRSCRLSSLVKPWLRSEYVNRLTFQRIYMDPCACACLANKKGFSWQTSKNVTESLSTSRACFRITLLSLQLNSNPGLVQDGVPDVFTLSLSSVKVGFLQEEKTGFYR